MLVVGVMRAEHNVAAHDVETHDVAVHEVLSDTVVVVVLK